MSGRAYTIRAVLLDADGVVQRPAAGWLHHVRALCGDPQNVEAFTQDVFDAEAPCLVGKDDFANALADVLQKWSSPASIDDALRVWTMIEPDRDVLQLVSRLRDRGQVVALATNQQAHRAAYMLHELAYAEAFDDVFCSCDLGVAKPDPAYFEACAAQLDLPKRDMLFIDDHERNVDAARAAGLCAEQFHLDDGLDILLETMRRHGVDPL